MGKFTKNAKIESLLGDFFAAEIISHSEMEELSAKRGMPTQMAELFYMGLFRGNKSVLRKVKDILHSHGHRDIAKLIPTV